MLEELRFRTIDLSQVNDIYGEVPREDTEEARKGLLESVKERHEGLSLSLKEDNFADMDSMPEINQSWQDEIARVSGLLAIIKNTLTKELEQRTKDLEKVIAVLKGEELPASLKQTVEDNQYRHSVQQKIMEEANVTEEDPEGTISENDIGVMTDNARWESLILALADVRLSFDLGVALVYVY